MFINWSSKIVPTNGTNLMKPNYSVDRFVQMEYDQAILDSCTRSKRCASLEKVIGVVPANEPLMVKLNIERKMILNYESYDMCKYLCLRFDVVYIGLCLSNCWRLSMVA